MRPVPVATAETRPFWEAAKRQELSLPRCPRCALLHYPPPPRCPKCLGIELRWERLSGRGRLKAWTTVAIDLLPGVKPPYVIAEVELAEQPDLVMVAHVTGGPLRVDAEVDTAFAEGYPEFRVR
jgi:uncharacterized OB-fold protein